VCHYADDWACACRYQDDTERFDRVLPTRLKKVNLRVAPEKTSLKALLCTSEASATEKLGVGTLHVGVCTGGAGEPAFLL
jgi:hypothetical protein